ncbi:cysteine/Histidine-rich C1 domain family protein [Striga asiatica]|uniref:Cysteine/Histidine-rich C1 domain family protein n=1 Tax=Striga asiatica TaxID=4170 RepID=A0A5A7P9I5_STRAF|nr:cysteine/Histidine-rich C1 domain family protein [Striga asiatica]
MPRLPIIILLNGQLPPRIIVRVRHHEHLQFLLIPLIPLVTHAPPLLPRAAILVQELDLIIQLLGSDIHSGRQKNGVVRGLLRNGLARPGRASSGRRRAEM